MTSISTPFIQVEKALNDEIVTQSGLKLYIDGSWNREIHTTVTGKVSALPLNGSHPVLKQLKVGDEVAFSYAVCSETVFANDSENFIESTEGSDHLKQWRNGKGYRLAVMAIPGGFHGIWVGTYNDRHGNLIDGRQGSEKEINKFLSQFSFGDGSELKFKNLIDIDGEDHWKAFYDDIFAVKKGDKIIACGDWLICEPVVIDQTTLWNLQNGLSLPPMSVAFRCTDRGVVVSGGGELGFKKGDVAAGGEKFWSDYDLWGKKYTLIRKRRVIGKYE